MIEVVPVQIDYRPRKWARPMHDSWKRWFVTVLHRRAGKTTAWLNHHVRAATDDEWERRRLLTLEPSFTQSEVKELLRERVYAHVLPSLTQAKTVAWDKLKYICRDIPDVKKNESELSVQFDPDSGERRVVRLFGADNIDALRGFPLSGLSLDEYSQHPPGIFGEVLSKSLADHLGYCAFLGTIKGKNQLYQAYEAAKNDPAWFTLWQDVNVSLATETGGTIKAIRRAMQDDLDAIQKGLMTQEEYDQEWFLSPHAAIKGAYYARQLADAYRDGRIRRVPYDQALPVFDVWDLGKGPKMPVGMFQRVGRQVQMIDYHEGSESDGIVDVIVELKKRPYIWGKHFAPHDIRATDISIGKTRWEVAAAVGWRFDEVPDIGVDDGISAGRLMFSRLWIDDARCAPFIEAIGQYRREWKDTQGQFGDKPVHDWASHPADMYRYAAVIEEQMRVDRHTRPPAKKPRGRFEGRSGAPGSGLGWTY